MNKAQRLERMEEYNATYQKQLARAKELLSALQTWDKKTINKNFFEYHFLYHDEKGETQKDWKGKLRTNFYFSNKQWDWDKYYKRIHLDGGDYIEVNSADTTEVVRATKEKIEKLENWIESNNDKMKKIKGIDEAKIIKEILAIKEKYQCEEIWTEIIDQVKY